MNTKIIGLKQINRIAMGQDGTTQAIPILTISDKVIEEFNYDVLLRSKKNDDNQTINTVFAFVDGIYYETEVRDIELQDIKNGDKIVGKEKIIYVNLISEIVDDDKFNDKYQFELAPVEQLEGEIIE